MTRVKKGERQSYSVEEKAAVVRFALASNNTRAAAHFGIAKSMVSKWVKALKNQHDDLKNRKSRRVGAGRKEFFPEEEKQLFAWFLQMREAALAVTYYGLKIEMLKLVAETAAPQTTPQKKSSRTISKLPRNGSNVFYIIMSLLFAVKQRYHKN
ncbi:4802_t:CDS:1 [Ambispora leptoticha]|uniref:4802_t:CDS:1 n=1 Tax=Ambispora leptoticha TaxID=144679 RepID=A0A9N8ZF61_9GLOM|nr:4802_t:CDS:1 [Ambispora leptoticha]